MILGIAHIAIAVEKIEESLKFWKEDFGLQLTSIEEVKTEGVKTAFLAVGKKREGDCHIELLEGTSLESPVSKFVAKLGGGGRGGIHHIAFLVDDLQSEIARLQSCGYQFVHPVRSNSPETTADAPAYRTSNWVNAVSRPGAKGTEVAFLHPKSCFGVLVELVQEPHSPSPRPGLRPSQDTGSSSSPSDPSPLPL